MDIQVKEDNGNLICLKHNKKIKLFILDSQMPFYDALVCSRCIKERPAVTKQIIDVDLVKKTIKEQYQNGKNEFECAKQTLVKDLKQLSNKIQDYKNKLIKEIDEVMKILNSWMNEIKGAKDTQSKYLIQKLQELHQNAEPKQNDQLLKINRANLIKLLGSFSKLLAKDDLASFEQPIQQLLQQSTSQQETQYISNSNIPQTINLINSIKQSNPCCAIAFNQSGTVMVAGFSKDIKVWEFDEGNLTDKQTLEGPKGLVFCLLFSKKLNWFASTHESRILGWKEYGKEWQSTQPNIQQHSSDINCLLLNKQEDELISCSDDQKIIVWNVDCYFNHIKYQYTLEHKHIDKVWSISLSESALVSCSSDETIILWMKGVDQKWEYIQQIEVGDGYRISFIDDATLIFQPNSKNQTKIFEIKNKSLQEVNNTVNLKEANDDMYLFPTIYNKNRQVIVQKYNQYVYILQRQVDGMLKIVLEPISCFDFRNYGAMTENGEYLIIWNSGTCEFNVHKIQY